MPVVKTALKLLVLKSKTEPFPATTLVNVVVPVNAKSTVAVSDTVNDHDEMGKPKKAVGAPVAVPLTVEPEAETTLPPIKLPSVNVAAEAVCIDNELKANNNAI